MDTNALARLFKVACSGDEYESKAMIKYALDNGQDKHLRNKCCFLYGRVLEFKGIKLSAADLRIRFDALALAIGYAKPTAGQAKTDEELLASFN